MAIAEIVNVTIAEVQSGTTLEGFNTPAILAAAADTTPTNYTDDSIRAKLYNLDADGLDAISDEWGSGSVALDMATQMAAQEEHPDSVYILRRGAAVATVKLITMSGVVASGQTVAVTINGVAFSALYATSSDATMTALALAIQTGANGVATAAYNTGVITVTATAEYPLSVGTAVATGSGALPTFVTTTSVPGRTAADDLTDAIAEDDTNGWYALVSGDTSKGVQLALAEAVESTEKFYWLRTDEADSKTAGGSTALAIRLAALNYRRTLGFWHHDLTEYVDAAALSYYLATNPGGIDLAHTALTGVTATPTSSLSAAAVAVLESRFFNTYRKFGAFGAVRKGVRVDGIVAEATRDLDYARNEYRVSFLLYLTQTKKPPYDASGLAAIQAIGDQVTRRLVAEGVFRGDVTASFFVPKFEDISPSNQALQKVPGCKVTATLLKGVLQVEIPLEITV